MVKIFFVCFRKLRISIKYSVIIFLFQNADIKAGCKFYNQVYLLFLIFFMKNFKHIQKQENASSCTHHQPILIALFSWNALPLEIFTRLTSSYLSEFNSNTWKGLINSQ